MAPSRTLYEVNALVWLGEQTWFRPEAPDLADVPEETVYRVLTVLAEHHGEFVTYQSAAREWTLERTLSEAALPYHDGAIRYFRERDLWNAELASRQEFLAPD